MTAVQLASHAQLYFVPETVGCWLKISPPPVDLKAQIKIAIHAMGTIIYFSMKSHRSLFGCMTRKGIWASQNKKNAIIVFVAIPWLAGIVFFMVRKLGQIAPSMTRTVLAPFMVCIAYQKRAKMQREMMAT